MKMCGTVWSFRSAPAMVVRIVVIPSVAKFQGTSVSLSMSGGLLAMKPAIHTPSGMETSGLKQRARHGIALNFHMRREMTKRAVMVVMVVTAAMAKKQSRKFLMSSVELKKHRNAKVLKVSKKVIVGGMGGSNAANWTNVMVAVENSARSVKRSIWQSVARTKIFLKVMRSALLMTGRISLVQRRRHTCNVVRMKTKCVRDA